MKRQFVSKIGTKALFGQPQGRHGLAMQASRAKPFVNASAKLSARSWRRGNSVVVAVLLNGGRSEIVRPSLIRTALFCCVSVTAILYAGHAGFAQSLTPVPDVSVNAPPASPGQTNDGSAAAGYRVDSSTASGPIWGDLSVQDSPYSISVIPSELIDNLQAWQPEQLVKVIPQITNVNPLQNVSGNPFFYIRGFSITEFTNGSGLTYDGMLGGAGGMFDTVLEDKERVEVLSGVDGFLYGTGSVGGNINYVLKRPTPIPYFSITGGENAGSNGYVHGDFGGPLKLPGLADGLVGYRLNIVGQDGNTSIENQDVKRDLISAAFDIHLPYDALLQFNAAHSNYHVSGLTPGFASSLNPYPAPANPATISEPSWLQFIDQTDVGGVKLTWKANDIFTVRSAWTFTDEVRQTQQTVSSNITSYAGNLTETSSGGGAATHWYTNSGYLFLDASFATWEFQHKVTTGFTGFSQFINGAPYTENLSTVTWNTNFYAQSQFAQPSTIYAANTTDYIYAENFGKNFVWGDEVKFNQFTLLAGANYATLGRTNFNSSGIETSGYGANALTPSISLLYKVLPWLTAYATYQQSLQEGVQVLNSGTTIYTNNGAVLSPYVGNQYEVGAKATVGKNLLLTAALFDIDKANIYSQNNGNGTYTYVESGREVHKGLELTAQGKIYDDLTVIGGFTAIDPRITNDPANSLVNGSIAAGVSPLSGKLYVEYDIPYVTEMPWLRGLTLIGGFQANSPYYENLPTTLKMPGYIVGDLGFRYTTQVYDHQLIVRFNVNNIANTAYWATNGYEGMPRTFLASATLKW
jgi:iron complex outermembrane recepter protein